MQKENHLFSNIKAKRRKNHWNFTTQ